MTEAEKIFDEEVRLKSQKVTPRGNLKTTKKIFHFEYLKGEALKKYTAPGEVRVYSMYDNLLPRDEYEKLSESEKVIAWKVWVQKYKPKEIAEFWGLSITRINGLRSACGVMLRNPPKVKPARKKEKKSYEGLIKYIDYKFLTRGAKLNALLNTRHLSNRELAEFWGISDKRVSKIRMDFGLNPKNTWDQDENIQEGEGKTANEPVEIVNAKTEKLPSNEEVLINKITSIDTIFREMTERINSLTSVVGNIFADEADIKYYREDVSGDTLTQYVLNYMGTIQKDKRYKIHLSIKEHLSNEK